MTRPPTDQRGPIPAPPAPAPDTAGIEEDTNSVEKARPADRGGSDGESYGQTVAKNQTKRATLFGVDELDWPGLLLLAVAMGFGVPLLTRTLLPNWQSGSLTAVLVPVYLTVAHWIAVVAIGGAVLCGLLDWLRERPTQAG
ncbi:hypothetical protein ACR5MH_0845 (plasmid) [Streptomyces sp. L7]